MKKAKGLTIIVLYLLILQSGFLQTALGKQNYPEGSFHFTGKNYTFEWSSADDKFILSDEKGLLIASGRLQPVIMVKQVGTDRAVSLVSTEMFRYESKNNQLQVFYKNVNGSAVIHLTLNCSEKCIWIDPVGYDTKNNEDIVSINHFASIVDDNLWSGMKSSHYVIPGITAGNAVSSVFHSYLQLNTTLSLGYALSLGYPVNGYSGFYQGWGLPSHYFAGFTKHQVPNEKKVMTQILSNGYCVGLAELPNADFWVDIRNENISPKFSYRSDIWHHMSGAGHYNLGSKMVITIGPNYYEAIRQYYRELLSAGIIRKNSETSSVNKQKIMLTPMFCTWGEQKAIGIYEQGTTDEILTSIYSKLRKSGMKSGLFVIDDKWENEYGSFEHSESKLPDFENFVDDIHKDGMYVGMWAAFLRCEHPEKYGLTIKNMLRKTNGEPLICSTSGKYYIFDVTQPEVQKVMRNQAKKFISRYKPDLVKFDYGYEVTPLTIAAPEDMNYAGEKFFEKALEVVVGAFREENPDIILMYYQVSPLLNKYIDLCSIDDLLLCAGDEDIEANRRIFFGGIMGEIGVPTYGSSGYEWKSAREIWFDTSPAGVLGSLQSFSGDEFGDTLSPVIIAKYNGIANILRKSVSFQITPLDCNYFSSAHGTHASSWARYENNKPVLLALRSYRLEGGKGASKFRNLVETNTSAIIASKTDDEIGKSNHLGIVPYGTGNLSITCEKKSGKYIIKEHLLGGKIIENKASIINGILNIRLRENTTSEDIIEWIEVVII